DAGERGGRGTIDDEAHLRMTLQETRRQRFRRFALHRLRQHARLRLTPREQHDATRLEDRADTHRDRVAGHVGLTEKVARGVTARQAVERYQTCARVAAGAGLVE